VRRRLSEGNTTRTFPEVSSKCITWRRTVRGKIYLMPANPDTLLRRYEHDFPEHVKEEALKNAHRHHRPAFDCPGSWPVPPLMSKHFAMILTENTLGRAQDRRDRQEHHPPHVRPPVRPARANGSISAYTNPCWIVRDRDQCGGSKFIESATGARGSGG